MVAAILALAIAQVDTEVTWQERVAVTPDQYQVDPNGLRDGGNWCGPTALSNGLIWLACNGYPEILPKAPSPAQAHIAMVRILAQPDYVNAGDGASPGEISRGFNKWIGTAGYAVDKEIRLGWRDPLGSANPRIDLSVVRQALSNRKSIVLANMGYYRADRTRGVLIRKGGHWLTVVGQVSRQGVPTFLIHDPATHPTRMSKTHQTELVPVGNFPVEGAGSLTDTSQLYALRHIRIKEDVAILDNVTIFRLK